MSETASHRVAYVSLGCRTNRVETDVIAARLVSAGCVLSKQDDADAVVINTCAVTGEAESKARKALRHAAFLPQAPVVVATGCVASLFGDSLMRAVPGIVVEPDKSRVPDRVIDALRARNEASRVHLAQLPKPPRGTAPEVCSVTPTGRTRPGIKVQDGCDLRCGYCIVWKARGRARSVPVGKVLEDVREAVRSGAGEVVLTGINVGCYRDPEAGDLTGLLGRILEDTEVGRVRLSSIEPPDVTDALLRTMAASGGRVAPFLHVCLQSGCDATLDRMQRVYGTGLFVDVVESARELLPDVALGTDIIVGFPGETDAEFAESLAFCEEMGFSRMHVFRYSRRPGTVAAQAPGQVAPRVMARRAASMRDLARRLRSVAAEKHLGTTQLCCVQAPGRAVSGTLFDVLVDPDLSVGELVPAKIRRVHDDSGTLDARLEGTV